MNEKAENDLNGDKSEKKIHYGKELISRHSAVKLHDVMCFGRSANMPDALVLTLTKESVTCARCLSLMCAGGEL